MPTPPAIHQVIEQNLDYLFRFAFFRTGNRADAEDIVHNACLRLLDRDLDGISPESLRMYLFKTTLNLCRSHLRDIATLPLDGIDPPDTAAEDAELHAEHERIHALLVSIPDREREVILMRAVDGLSFAEIGRVLDLAPTTVQYRYASGMNRLRHNISPSKQ